MSLRRSVSNHASTRPKASASIVSNVVAEQGKVDAFHMTCIIMAQDCLPKLPAGVTKVWALTVYPSIFAYQEDQTATSRSTRQEALAMVPTHQFLMPESKRKSDDKLFPQSIELARHDDFREKRAKFHRWQEDIIEQQIQTDLVMAEIEDDPKQFEAIARKARIRHRIFAVRSKTRHQRRQLRRRRDGPRYSAAFFSQAGELS